VKIEDAEEHETEKFHLKTAEVWTQAEKDRRRSDVGERRDQSGVSAEGINGERRCYNFTVCVLKRVQYSDERRRQ